MNLVDIPISLKGKLYRSPMPCGLFDKDCELLTRYREAGITTIVMLIPNQESLFRDDIDLLGLYRDEGFRVLYFPISNYYVPESAAATRELVDEIIAQATNGDNIVIHCYGGWGRTGTILALIARRLFGFSGPDAVSWVRRLVPGSVETEEQEQYVAEFTFP